MKVESLKGSIVGLKIANSGGRETATFKLDVLAGAGTAEGNLLHSFAPEVAQLQHHAQDRAFKQDKADREGLVIDGRRFGKGEHHFRLWGLPIEARAGGCVPALDMVAATIGKKVRAFIGPEQVRVRFELVAEAGTFDDLPVRDLRRIIGTDVYVDAEENQTSIPEVEPTKRKRKADRQLGLDEVEPVPAPAAPRGARGTALAEPRRPRRTDETTAEMAARVMHERIVCTSVEHADGTVETFAPPLDIRCDDEYGTDGETQAAPRAPAGATLASMASVNDEAVVSYLKVWNLDQLRAIYRDAAGQQADEGADEDALREAIRLVVAEARDAAAGDDGADAPPAGAEVNAEEQPAPLAFTPLTADELREVPEVEEQLARWPTPQLVAQFVGGPQRSIRRGYDPCSGATSRDGARATRTMSAGGLKAGVAGHQRPRIGGRAPPMQHASV